MYLCQVFLLEFPGSFLNILLIGLALDRQGNCLLSNISTVPGASTNVHFNTFTRCAVKSLKGSSEKEVTQIINGPLGDCSTASEEEQFQEISTVILTQSGVVERIAFKNIASITSN